MIQKNTILNTNKLPPIVQTVQFGAKKTKVKKKKGRP